MKHILIMLMSISGTLMSAPSCTPNTTKKGFFIQIPNSEVIAAKTEQTIHAFVTNIHARYKRLSDDQNVDAFVLWEQVRALSEELFDPNSILSPTLGRKFAPTLKALSNVNPGWLRLTSSLITIFMARSISAMIATLRGTSITIEAPEQRAWNNDRFIYTVHIALNTDSGQVLKGTFTINAIPHKSGMLRLYLRDFAMEGVAILPSLRNKAESMRTKSNPRDLREFLCLLITDVAELEKYLAPKALMRLEKLKKLVRYTPPPKEK